MSLPNQIIPIKNADKGFHEKWTKNRNKLNFPHPTRAVLTAPPNCGKSTVVKNLLMRAEPPFQHVIICHCDNNYTQEYDDISEGVEEFELIDNIPPPESFEGLVKTLVILDDLEFKGMSKDQKRNLDRLFGYVSTHKNCSVYLCSQDAFNIPPIVRRCSNLFVLWKSPDLLSMSQLAGRTGLKADELSELFSLCKEHHDSVWLDITPKTPYPIRLNGFKVIEKKE
jgi:hypothetical protein